MRDKNICMQCGEPLGSFVHYALPHINSLKFCSLECKEAFDHETSKVKAEMRVLWR